MSGSGLAAAGAWARPVLALLVALWLGATVAVWFTATSNFRTIDRILDPAFRPEYLEHARPLEGGRLRSTLRFLSSELNRRMFSAWGGTQIALSVLAAGLVAVWPGRTRWLLAGALAVLVVCLIVGVWLTPTIRSVGRAMDFLPRPLPGAHAALGRRFGLLHALYLGLDLIKTGLLLALWIAVWRNGPSTPP